MLKPIENYYPIPGGQGVEEDHERSPVEVPLKLKLARN